MSAPKLCKQLGCDRTMIARGLCRRHYLVETRAGRIHEHAPTPRLLAECPADHPHTSETCWEQHSCRCKTCLLSRAAFLDRRRRRLRAYGRPEEIGVPRTDAAPAREHCIALRDAGYGLDRIADAAGVSRNAVQTLVYGYRGRRSTSPLALIKQDHATRLLAVSRDTIAAARQPVFRAARRLQALAAIGYRPSDLAAELGLTIYNLHPILHGKQRWVTQATHDRVVALYVARWQHPPTGPTAARARAHANRYGWSSPLDWIDIDDPAEQPAVDEAIAAEAADIDVIAIEIAMSGHRVNLTRSEVVELVKQLHPRKWGDTRIAQVAGRDPVVIWRIRDGLGLPAWPAHEQAAA